MKKIQIKTNSKGEVNIDNDVKFNGIRVALLDDKGTPIANYEISSERLSGHAILRYSANNCRIHFYCDENSELTPTMKSEILSTNDY